jgi:hypothetical protein
VKLPSTTVEVEVSGSRELTTAEQERLTEVLRKAALGFLWECPGLYQFNADASVTNTLVGKKG